MPATPQWNSKQKQATGKFGASEDGMDFGDKDGGSDDENGSEDGDQVGSLIFKTEENQIFDSVLESSGETR